jgi:transposase-like protein
VTVSWFAFSFSSVMPWKTSSLLEARQRFVHTALRGFKSVAQLCREARISCKTGFKWLHRFRASGGPGLRDRSRRPKHSPRRTASRWLTAIRVLRRKHSRWGGKKIYARLRQQHPRTRLPKPRTITDWLFRFGGRRPQRNKTRPGPKQARPALTIPQAANDVWTVDFKGWFRTRDGQRVNPLTVRDLFSRFLLGIRLLSLEHTPVQRYFQALFARYGLPKVIRVDHGAPFAGVGPLDLSRLSAWWLRLGIRVEFTRRACPQDNGAHEQMHRIYKADTAARPVGRATATNNVRTKHWGNGCLRGCITKAAGAIAGHCGGCSIGVTGKLAVSVRAASSLGVDAPVASVAPSAESTSDSNR